MMQSSFTRFNIALFLLSSEAITPVMVLYSLSLLWMIHKKPGSVFHTPQKEQILAAKLQNNSQNV